MPLGARVGYYIVGGRLGSGVLGRLEPPMWAEWRVGSNYWPSVIVPRGQAPWGRHPATGARASSHGEEGGSEEFVDQDGLGATFGGPFCCHDCRTPSLDLPWRAIMHV